MRIAAGRRPVVVNDADDIFQLDNDGWRQLPGKAKDVSAQRAYFGQPDEVSIIGTNPVDGGFGIFQWDNVRQDWIELPGGGVAISGGIASWVVNDRDEIFSRAEGGWLQRPGAAKDVAADYGNIWVVGTNPTFGGFDIRQWDVSRQDWNVVDGGAIRIAVGGDVTNSTVFKGPCVVNVRDEIFRRV